MDPESPIPMLHTTLLLLAPTLQTADTAYVVEGFQDGARMGAAIEGIGDWDGDGVDDYAVGTPDYDAFQLFAPSLTDLGRVDIVSGADGGFLESYLDFSQVDGNGDSLAPRVGGAIAGGFGITPNGIDEFAVGLPGVNEVHVLERGLFSGNLILVQVLDGGNESLYDLREFGACVENVGDIDGDGDDDLAIGAPGTDFAVPGIFGSPPQVTPGVGRVQLYSGADLSLLGAWSASAEEERFGTSIARLEDMTGDGRPELLVGAPGDLDANPFLSGGGSGRAYIVDTSVPGSAGLWATIPGTTANEAFGHAVLSLGDLDGGGEDEFFVGAPLWNTNGSTSLTKRGKAYVFSGETLGLLWEQAGSFYSRYGEDAAFADVTGDGVKELLLMDRSTFEISRGELEARDPLTGALVTDWVAWPAGEGAAIASGVDVNSDGVDDVLVGAVDLDLGRGGVLALTYDPQGTPYAGPPRTWTVDPSGNGDFRSVAVAMFLVEDGDTVLVEPADYGDFQAWRDLKLIGRIEGTDRPFAAQILIDEVDTFELHGFRTENPNVARTTGRVTLSDLSIAGGLDMFSNQDVTLIDSVVLAIDSTQSAFANAAVSGTGTDVQLVDSVLIAADGDAGFQDGGAGLFAGAGCRVWISNCRIYGGDGRIGGTSVLGPPAGGAGVLIGADGTVDIRGNGQTAIEGGSGGSDSSGPGPDGADLRAVGTGVITVSAGVTGPFTTEGDNVVFESEVTPFITYSALQPIGTVEPVEIWADAGDVIVFLSSLGAAKLELPFLAKTPAWIDPATLGLPIGITVSFGLGIDVPFNQPVVIPNDPALVGAQFHVQGLEYDPLTGLYTGTNGGAVTVGP